MKMKIIKAVGLSPKHVLSPGAIVSVPEEVPSDVAGLWIGAGIAVQDTSDLSSVTGVFRKNEDIAEDIGED